MAKEEEAASSSEARQDAASDHRNLRSIGRSRTFVIDKEPSTGVLGGEVEEEVASVAAAVATAPTPAPRAPRSRTPPPPASSAGDGPAPGAGPPEVVRVVGVAGALRKLFRRQRRQPQPSSSDAKTWSGPLDAEEARASATATAAALPDATQPSAAPVPAPRHSRVPQPEAPLQHGSQKPEGLSKPTERSESSPQPRVAEPEGLSKPRGRSESPPQPHPLLPEGLSKPTERSESPSQSHPQQPEGLPDSPGRSESPPQPHFQQPEGLPDSPGRSESPSQSHPQQPEGLSKPPERSESPPQPHPQQLEGLPDPPGRSASPAGRAGRGRGGRRLLRRQHARQQADADSSSPEDARPPRIVTEAEVHAPDVSSDEEPREDLDRAAVTEQVTETVQQVEAVRSDVHVPDDGEVIAPVGDMRDSQNIESDVLTNSQPTSPTVDDPVEDSVVEDSVLDVTSEGGDIGDVPSVVTVLAASPEEPATSAAVEDVPAPVSGAQEGEEVDEPRKGPEDARSAPREGRTYHDLDEATRARLQQEIVRRLQESPHEFQSREQLERELDESRAALDAMFDTAAESEQLLERSRHLLARVQRLRDEVASCFPGRGAAQAVSGRGGVGSALAYIILQTRFSDLAESGAARVAGRLDWAEGEASQFILYSRR